jgi:hypothetical protein
MTFDVYRTTKVISVSVGPPYPAFVRFRGAADGWIAV